MYLLDVIDGVLPAQIPKDLKKAEKAERAAYEEERRLFYVGITRAKNQLSVFTMKTQHSSFCDELFQRTPKKSSVQPTTAYRGTAPSSWGGYISITGRNRR